MEQHLYREPTVAWTFKLRDQMTPLVEGCSGNL